MKRLIRGLVPGPLRRRWRRTFDWRWFAGDCASWAEARAVSRGYDTLPFLKNDCASGDFS